MMSIYQWWNGLSVTNIQFLVLGFALATALLGVRYFRLRGEFLRLQKGVKALLRNTPASPMRLSMQVAQDTWNSIIALAARSRPIDSAKKTYNEMIHLGSSISLNSDTADSTARAVVQLLLRQAAPEVCAAAIVRRDPVEKSVKIEYAQGVPAGRLNEILLGWFESFVDKVQDANWGYSLPLKGSLRDLSIFGIGYSFTTPLLEQDEISGLIWLGFRKDASGLTDEKREFIRAICDHCAASLRTANRIQRRIDQSNKEKDFLIGLSHDLRSPGNSALYALRDLLSDNENQLSVEQVLRLRFVENCLEDQLDLLDDIFDYTKHRRGLLNADKTPCDLKFILEPLLEVYRQQAEQKGILLVCEQIPETTLNGDPRHMRRILGNLLGNAIKYTNKGEVLVKFDGSDSTMTVSVIDTGIGIPESERRTLFQEFSRMTNASHIPGVGLGLAISKVLADLNNAELHFRPNAGAGSIFEVVFETTRSRNSDNAHSKLNKILIVDDDPISRRHTSRLVESLALEIINASEVDEAKRLLEEQTPDLLITDYYLGDATADDLIALAERNGQEMRTIVVSGASNISDRVTGRISARMPIRLLQKPVNEVVLREAISSFMTES